MAQASRTPELGKKTSKVILEKVTNLLGIDEVESSEGGEKAKENVEKVEVGEDAVEEYLL